MEGRVAGLGHSAERRLHPRGRPVAAPPRVAYADRLQGTFRSCAAGANKETAIDIYFDFSCPYSRRTGMWWRDLGETARWRPFLLREHNRSGDEEPEWEREDAVDHVSVLALALHEAVETTGGDSAAYRWSAMEAFERGRVEPTALRELAEHAAGRALDEHQLQDGLAAVATSHQHALTLNVFGTPTLIDGEHRAYLKLAEMPSKERTRSVFDALEAVLVATPEIAEIKRPN